MMKCIYCQTKTHMGLTLSTAIKQQHTDTPKYSPPNAIRTALATGSFIAFANGNWSATVNPSVSHAALVASSKSYCGTSQFQGIIMAYFKPAYDQSVTCHISVRQSKDLLYSACSPHRRYDTPQEVYKVSKQAL